VLAYPPCITDEASEELDALVRAQKNNFATTARSAARQLVASLAPAVTTVRAPRLDRMACDRLADRCAAAAARHELTGHLPCAAHRWRKRSWSSTRTMAAAGCWWCLSIMNNPVMMPLNHPSSLDALALVGEVGVQASSHSQPFSSSPSLHATHASRHDMCCACTTRIQYKAGAPALAAVLVVTMQQPARRSYLPSTIKPRQGRPYLPSTIKPRQGRPYLQSTIKPPGGGLMGRGSRTATLATTTPNLLPYPGTLRWQAGARDGRVGGGGATQA